jgi:polysaccharide biosynthesis protein PelE
MSRRPSYLLRALALALGLLGLELAGVVALLWAQGAVQTYGFALCHGMASILAMSAWLVLPRVYRYGRPGRKRAPGQDAPPERDRGSRKPWQSFLALCVLVLFLPGFGVLGLLLAVLPALHRPIARRERDWRRFGVPSLPATLFEPESRRSPVAGGTSLIDIIDISDARDASDSDRSGDDARLAAVLALRQLPTRPAVPILRLALRDAVDDVRLLAYSMLDRRDGALQARIQKYERALARGDIEPKEAAALEYSLAQLHWELAYTGLAAGAVEDRALDSSARHARAVLERPAKAGESVQGNELAALFLLGRILLRKGALDEAEAVLEDARARGFADASIRPYLAEIAFLRRDFARIKEHLRALGPDGEQRPGLIADLCRFWLPREA